MGAARGHVECNTVKGAWACGKMQRDALRKHKAYHVIMGLDGLRPTVAAWSTRKCAPCLPWPCARSWSPPTTATTPTRSTSRPRGTAQRCIRSPRPWGRLQHAPRGRTSSTSGSSGCTARSSGLGPAALEAAPGRRTRAAAGRRPGERRRGKGSRGYERRHAPAGHFRPWVFGQYVSLYPTYGRPCHVPYKPLLPHLLLTAPTLTPARIIPRRRPLAPAAERLKATGNQALFEARWTAAVEAFTTALHLAPGAAVLYALRAGGRGGDAADCWATRKRWLSTGGGSMRHVLLPLTSPPVQVPHLQAFNPSGRAGQP